VQLPVLAALHDISPPHGVDAEEAEMLHGDGGRRREMRVSEPPG
jgi:hypothetical protein